MATSYENEKSDFPGLPALPAPLSTYTQILGLKRRFRRGWLRAGLSKEQCESVADHSYGVSMLCMLMAPHWSEPLDVSHATQLALVHELGEVHAGDITPADGAGKPEKHKREQESLETVLADLDPPTANHIRGLWTEYEEGITSAARFVKAMDKLEMALQAAVYQNDGLGDMHEFILSAQQGLSTTPFETTIEDIRAIFLRSAGPA